MKAAYSLIFALTAGLIGGAIGGAVYGKFFYPKPDATLECRQLVEALEGTSNLSAERMYEACLYRKMGIR